MRSKFREKTNYLIFWLIVIYGYMSWYRNLCISGYKIYTRYYSFKMKQQIIIEKPQILLKFLMIWIFAESGDECNNYLHQERFILNKGKGIVTELKKYFLETNTAKVLLDLNHS